MNKLQFLARKNIQIQQSFGSAVIKKPHFLKGKIKCQQFSNAEEMRNWKSFLIGLR